MSDKVDISGLSKKLQQLADVPDDVMKSAYDVFKKTTPVKSGNARRRTRLSDSEIQADYAYAAVLDGGRRRENGREVGSTQAPKGMSEPTIAAIRKKIDAEVKKIRG